MGSVSPPRTQSARQNEQNCQNPFFVDTFVASLHLSGICGAKFSKILKKFDTQDYADCGREVRENTDDADVTDWGAHAARVHVSAASLKQSLFHTKTTKDTKGEVWSADSLGPDYTD